MPDDRQPWDKQHAETDKAFEAFRLYRDMGADRSQAKVAEEMDHNSPRHVERWASKHDWTDRIDAWTRHQDQRRQKKFQERQDEVLEMFYDHLEEIGRAALAEALAEGDPNIRLIIDLMDRCGLKPKEQTEIQIGSQEAGEDKVSDLLPEVGQDQRDE